MYYIMQDLSVTTKFTPNEVSITIGSEATENALIIRIEIFADKKVTKTRITHDNEPIGPILVAHYAYIDETVFAFSPMELLIVAVESYSTFYKSIDAPEAKEIQGITDFIRNCYLIRKTVIDDILSSAKDSAMSFYEGEIPEEFL